MNQDSWTVWAACNDTINMRTVSHPGHVNDNRQGNYYRLPILPQYTCIKSPVHQPCSCLPTGHHGRLSSRWTCSLNTLHLRRFCHKKSTYLSQPALYGVNKQMWAIGPRPRPSHTDRAGAAGRSRPCRGGEIRPSEVQHLGLHLLSLT